MCVRGGGQVLVRLGLWLLPCRVLAEVRPAEGTDPSDLEA